MLKPFHTVPRGTLPEAWLPILLSSLLCLLAWRLAPQTVQRLLELLMSGMHIYCSGQAV